MRLLGSRLFSGFFFTLKFSFKQSGHQQLFLDLRVRVSYYHIK